MLGSMSEALSRQECICGEQGSKKVSLAKVELELSGWQSVLLRSLQVTKSSRICRDPPAVLETARLLESRPLFYNFCKILSSLEWALST